MKLRPITLAALANLITGKPATRLKWCLEITVVFAVCLQPLVVNAQAWPTKPLRLIVRATPGGADDLHARICATHLSKVLGQQVIVDYRPGAGGLVAWETVAKSPPDGYTTLLAASGLAGIQSLRPDLPVDPWKEIAWVSQIANFPLIFIVHPALPVRDLKELVALARRKPGALSYGSSGVGATPHLAFEYLRSAAKVNVLHVPFKGSSQMYVDLMGGRIEIGSSVLGSAIPFVKSGRLRAMAVTSAKRAAQVPEVPTVAEALKLPDFEFTPFYAIVVQGQTPREIVQALATAINRVSTLPEYRDAVQRAGSEPAANSPEQMLAVAKRAAGQIDAIVKFAGITTTD